MANRRSSRIADKAARQRPTTTPNSIDNRKAQQNQQRQQRATRRVANKLQAWVVIPQVNVPSRSILGAATADPATAPNPDPTTLIVDVGPDRDRERFILSKAEAIRASGFFYTATSLPWTSTKAPGDADVTLPECTPAAFAIFEEFLDRDVITITPLVKSHHSDKEDRYKDRLWAFYRLYSLGMYLQAFDFANMITDRWDSYISGSDNLPSLDLCNEISDNLPERCSLRRLNFHHVRRVDSAYLISHVDSMGENLKDDLITGTFMLADQEFGLRDDVATDRCKFHEHDARFPRCP